MSNEPTPEQQKIIDEAGKQMIHIFQETRKRLKALPEPFDPFGTCTRGGLDHCAGFEAVSGTSIKCVCGHSFFEHRVW